MRARAAIIVLCAVAALLATACGAQGPHVWTSANRHPRLLAATTSPEYAQTLHWSGISIPSGTGFYVYENGAQVADVTASPYVFQGLACGTTYTLGVKAHDGSGSTSPLYSTTYMTPACPGGPTDFNGLSTNPSFFPVAVWYQGTSNLATYQSIGVNTFYSPSAYSSSDLSALASDSMTVIQCSTVGNPASTYTGADGSTNTNYAPTTCPADSRTDPNASIIKGWMDLPDEPDTSQQTSSTNYGPCVAPSDIKTETDAIKAADSTRAIVADFNAPGTSTTGRGSYCHYQTLGFYPQYLRDATLATFDIYPLNYGYPMDAPANTVARLHAMFQAAGQDKPVMPVLETTPIHTGSTGPTAAQLHFELWSSVVQGANAIGYFCHEITPTFNEAGCLDGTLAPGIEAEMSADDSLLSQLGGALNSTSLTSGAASVSASFPVDTVTKLSGGYEYVFSYADDPTGGSATFTIPGGGSGTVTVLGESRTVTMTNGSFTDSFGGCSTSTCSSTAVHIYKIPYSSYACPSGVRCFYIATNGSDSNNGTSESTPWAHAPGMVSFTGTYTHQAGDEFIFKGGDTWGNSNFPLTLTGSGTSTHPDYYGVDPAWYDGTSWTQPAFDAQNSDISGSWDEFIQAHNKDYFTIDNLKFEHWTATSLTTGYASCGMIDINNGGGSGDQHVTIDHITVTAWNVDSTGDSSNADCALIEASTSGSFAGESTVENSTFTGSGTSYGRVIEDVANVENNTLSGFTNGIYPSVPSNGTGTISGNVISDCGYPSWPNGATSAHGDSILVNTTGNPTTMYIHDNVIHDTGASGGNECESMWFGNNGETDYVYNNVLYNLHGTGEMKDGNNNGDTSAGTAYIWDNTIEGSQDGSNPCITGYSSGIPSVAVTIQNNLCVSNNASALGTFYCTGGGTACQSFSNNTLISTSQMTTDTGQSSGLFSTSPYQWLETGNPSPTTGAGVNLSSDCTGALTSLCQDTTYGGQRTTYTRPGANGWDVGAYQEP